MTQPVSRRNFLRSAAGTAVLAAGGSTLLSACSAPWADDAPAKAATGGRSGGTLRAAFVGGGAAETLDFMHGPTPLDYIRARAQHGALGAIDPTQPDGVRYEILESIEPSRDLGTYTLRVRRGLTFTDGSPVTAKDVLWSLRAPVQLKALPFLLSPSQTFDLGRARVVDAHTLRLPTVRPVIDGRLILCQTTLVIKDGTRRFTPKTPSCGPFRLTAFEAGRGATLTRHDGWKVGRGPMLDSLQLLSIPDGQARANALRAGQVDYADDLPPVTARALTGRSGLHLTTSDSPNLTKLAFAMNLAHAPFADPRVRMAFRLAADRERMVRTGLLGYGVVGNDLSSPGFPGYAGGIPQRRHDPDRARKLLADAGHGDMPITLVTGPEAAGMTEVATLFVEDLKAIGVRAELDERPAGTLFSDPKYFATPFAATYSPPTPLLSGYQNGQAAGAPPAFGYANPRVDRLVARARATADQGASDRLAAQAQEILHEEGNSVVPVFTKSISAHTSGVGGVRRTPFSDFGAATIR